MESSTLTILIVTYILTGVVFIVLAIPLIRGVVKPNQWYGFRVPQTLNNPEIWYAANAYTGRLVLTVGILLVLAAIGLVPLPGMDLDIYVAACTLILVGGLLGALLLSSRYLRSLVKR